MVSHPLGLDMEATLSERVEPTLVTRPSTDAGIPRSIASAANSKRRFFCFSVRGLGRKVTVRSGNLHLCGGTTSPSTVLNAAKACAFSCSGLICTLGAAGGFADTSPSNCGSTTASATTSANDLRAGTLPNISGSRDLVASVLTASAIRFSPSPIFLADLGLFAKSCIISRDTGSCETKSC